MRCNSMQQGVTYSFKIYYTPKLAIVWQTTKLSQHYHQNKIF